MTIFRMPNPLVTIITVNFNQLEETCALLDSIRRNDYRQVEVIVIDNASEENPHLYLSVHYPEVKCIVSSENLGFAGGNNLGVRYARGEYLFFINNDAELTAGCIQTLLQTFAENPRLGIVSPMLCYFERKRNSSYDIIQYAGTTPIHPITGRNQTIGYLEEDKGQYVAAQPTAYVHGASMMVPRKVINEIGGMSEDFFLYYEELDWCERIRRAGYEIYVAPRAKVHHKESITVGKKSLIKTYYMNRNRILFMHRNRSIWQFFLFSMYMLFVMVPKHTLQYLLNGEPDHFKKLLQAIEWNYFFKEEKKSKPQAEMEKHKTGDLKESLVEI